MSSFSAAVSLVEWPEAIPKEMLPAQGHLDVVVQALGRDEEDALARKLGMPERQVRERGWIELREG